jgi:WD40 repeat protein
MQDGMDQFLSDVPIGGGSKSSILDTVERLAKIFAIVAIPIVIPIALAIYSARVQQATQSETINRDYVQLAVSVLEQKKNDVDPGLRDWAVDLLDEHSPTKFQPAVVAALKSGAVSLPALIAGITETVSTISTNKQWSATAGPEGIRLVNSLSGHSFLVRGKKSPVSLSFSSDGKLFLIADQTGSVSVFDLTKEQEISSFHVPPNPLTAVFEPSGKIQIVLSNGAIVEYTAHGKTVTHSPFTIPSPPELH